jgi:hypothetical protein
MCELKIGTLVTSNWDYIEGFSADCELTIKCYDELDKFISSIADLMTDIDKADTALLRDAKEIK